MMAPVPSLQGLHSRRGIVLYDFLQVPGGAERVTLELARNLPNADLGCAFRDPAFFPDTLLEPLRVIELGARTSRAVWRTLLGMHVFRHRSEFLSRYDWVVYSGSNAPMAVWNHPKGRNILYCHTLPRFAYDLRDYYLAQLPWWQRPALHGLIAYVRPRYEAACGRMDTLIANSENVRQRIRAYLGREALVIHPPCETEAFQWLGQGDYYLSSARLEPFKRVEAIIRAFLRLPDKRLVVASGGSERPRLQQMARDAKNIHFTDWLDESELQRLTGQALATLYVPMNEDFGMSPVESMAAGKPVIGVAEGGVLETVVHGQTGWLVAPDNLEAGIIEAVTNLTPQRALAMRSQCEARAGEFSKAVFLEKMLQVVASS